MRYLIKYTVAGIYAQSVVEIDNNNDVLKKTAKALKINQSQILKTSKEFGQARELVKEDDLLMILSMLNAAELSSGKTLEKTLIDALIGIYPNDKNILNQTKIWQIKSLSLVEMLQMLNIDKVVITLVESGTNGNMSEALEEAQAYLKLSNESKALSGAGFATNVVFIFVAIVMVLTMSFIISDPYNKIIAIKGVAEPGIITFMNFIVANIVSIVSIILSMVIAVVVSFTNQQVFSKVKHLALWRIVNHLKHLKSAIVFLPLYTTLKKINHLDVDIVKAYQKVQPKIAQELLEQINKGNSLSYAIIESDLPKTISRQMSNIFDIENINIRNKAVKSLIQVLNLQIKKQSAKIASIFLIIRNIFVLTAIIFMMNVYMVGMQI